MKEFRNTRWANVFAGIDESTTHLTLTGIYGQGSYVDKPYQIKELRIGDLMINDIQCLYQLIWSCCKTLELLSFACEGVARSILNPIFHCTYRIYPRLRCIHGIPPQLNPDCFSLDFPRLVHATVCNPRMIRDGIPHAPVNAMLFRTCRMNQCRLETITTFRVLMRSRLSRHMIDLVCSKITNIEPVDMRPLPTDVIPTDAEYFKCEVNHQRKQYVENKRIEYKKRKIQYIEEKKNYKRLVREMEEEGTCAERSGAQAPSEISIKRNL
jgi:hypothetical protein